MSFRNRYDIEILLSFALTLRSSMQIAAGLGHCVGITQSGELFAWGWASAGQLGLGDTAGASSIAYPRNISKLSGLTGLQGSLLAASRVHSLISTGPLPSKMCQSVLQNARHSSNFFSSIVLHFCHGCILGKKPKDHLSKLSIGSIVLHHAVLLSCPVCSNLSLQQLPACR